MSSKTCFIYTPYTFVMDLRDLEAIVAIADEGSFTAAAQRLLVAQPAVSHQILRLERRLGYRLFERSASGSRPTQECVRLLPGARVVLTAMAEVEAATVVGRDPVWPIRLGAAFGISRDVVATAVRHAVSVGLVPTVARSGAQHLTERVAKGDLDLALTTMPTHRARPGLRVHWLAPVPVVAVTSDEDQLGSHASLIEVLSRPLLILGPAAGIRDTLARVARSHDLTLTIATEADDPALLTELAVTGLGVALLPRDLLVPHPHLRTVELTDSPLRHQPALVWPAHVPSNRDVAAYYDSIADLFAAGGK